MAKKRKTRSQKMAADLRHQHQPSSTPHSPTISLSDMGIKPSEKIVPSTPSPVTHSAGMEYQFVKHDLLKTSTITGAIILVELMLFFVVKL